MELSNNTKKRFIKDYSLPIQLFQDDYFDYFINLYNPLLHTKDKLAKLQACLTPDICKSEEDFFNAGQELRDSIIDNIKSSKAYIEFNTMNMNDYAVKSSFPTNDIYKQTNDGRYFISVDLRKANFQALRYANVLDSSVETYEELLKKYTDNEKLLDYFTGSKYLRQVIFGNLNPARQVTIQKYLTYEIYKLLKHDGYFDEPILDSQVRVLTNDEIIIEIEKPIYNECYPHIIEEVINRYLDIDVSVEYFKLKYYEEPIPHYIKYFTDGGIEFCCVPIVYFAQVYKSYFKLPLTDYDFRFMYENRIAELVR